VARAISVEPLFPQGRERFELASSGRSRVLGIDAIGGPPHCDFADEGGVRVASRRCPDWLGSRPAGFNGEPGNVLVGLIGLCDGLGSDKLSGCHVKAVGVALDRLEKPGRWIVELAQHGAGRDRRFVASKDLLQPLGRRTRGDGVGTDEGVGSPSRQPAGKGGWRAGRG